MYQIATIAASLKIHTPGCWSTRSHRNVCRRAWRQCSGEIRDVPHLLGTFCRYCGTTIGLDTCKGAWPGYGPCCYRHSRTYDRESVRGNVTLFFFTFHGPELIINCQLLPVLKGPLPSIIALHPPPSDPELFLLRSIEWTTFGKSTHETALEQANVILRYFLGTFAVDLQHINVLKPPHFFRVWKSSSGAKTARDVATRAGVHWRA